MSTQDKMNIDERWKYLRMMKRRYEQARRQECKRLLDEMEAVTGLHRKSLIRLMNSHLERESRQRQRGSTYGVEVDDALRVIAESWDYICALVLYGQVQGRAADAEPGVDGRALGATRRIGNLTTAAGAARAHQCVHRWASAWPAQAR